MSYSDELPDVKMSTVVKEKMETLALSTSTPLVPMVTVSPRKILENYLDSADTELALYVDSADNGTKSSKSTLSKGDAERIKDVIDDTKSPGDASHQGQPTTHPESQCHSRQSLGRPGNPIVTVLCPDLTLQQHSVHRPTSTSPTKSQSNYTPRPSLDLHMLNHPMTPQTEHHKDVLTPNIVPCIVPLNTVTSTKEPPLYIIHPITGCITMYERLGKELRFPCYGIQRTKETPTDSIHNMARYYKGKIEENQPVGPYRISGYSIGTIIAVEIVRLLLKDGKQVDKLMLVDSSPLYIQTQISHDMKHLPPNASQDQVYDALVTGSLVNWLTYYRPTENRLLLYGQLKKQPSVSEKIEAAVDLSFGNAINSSSPAKTKWLTAKSKILQKGKEESSNKMLDTGREVVRLLRREKATEYIDQVHLAYQYRMERKIGCDIWLMRVVTDPVFGYKELSGNYGLDTVTTGQVHIKYYHGQHTSLLTGEFISPLATDINDLMLGHLNTGDT